MFISSYGLSTRTLNAVNFESVTNLVQEKFQQQRANSEWGLSISSGPDDTQGEQDDDEDDDPRFLLQHASLQDPEEMYHSAVELAALGK